MKKQLLKESDVRKMMKFANLGPLTDGFVERLSEMNYKEDDETNEGMGHYGADDDDETKEEGMGHMGVDDEKQEEAMGAGHQGQDDKDKPDTDDTPLPADDDMGDPMAGDDKDPMADDTEPAGGDMAMGGADPDAVKDAVMKIVDALEKTVQEMFGEAAPELDASEVADADAGDVGDMDPPMAADAGDMDPMAGGGMAAKDDPGLDEENLEEDFINEMTRRVAARLVKASRKD